MLSAKEQKAYEGTKPPASHGREGCVLQVESSDAHFCRIFPHREIVFPLTKEMCMFHDLNEMNENVCVNTVYVVI